MLRDKLGRFTRRQQSTQESIPPGAQGYVMINGVKRYVNSDQHQLFRAWKDDIKLGKVDRNTQFEDWIASPHASSYLIPLLNGGNTETPVTTTTSQGEVTGSDSNGTLSSTANPESLNAGTNTSDINTGVSGSLNAGVSGTSINTGNNNTALMNGSIPLVVTPLLKTTGSTTTSDVAVDNSSTSEAEPAAVSVNTNSDTTETVVGADDADPSGGMKFFDTGSKKPRDFTIDKEKLVNFLDFANAGLGASVNNKIAERALQAEKPLLQDVSESHRSVFGDYRAKVQGEQAAAQLRSLAAKPLTSDGALQQQMMLEAQIQGQQYIDQGNAKDDEMIRQTREVAWQQNKENQLQRQAVAMQNRQAMLMTEKNKTQIENMRDSANYSQVVAPLMKDIAAQMRAKAKEQQYWQDYYDETAIVDEVWRTYQGDLTDTERELLAAYRSGGQGSVYPLIANDSAKEQVFYTLQNKINQEAMNQLALKRGIRLGQSSTTDLSGRYGQFANASLSGYGGFYKDGGKVYRAKLTKRTRDNDRTARSMEANQKRAARLLEKAMDSLYTYESVELIAKPTKKRKKKKFQAGGALPFVSYTPSFTTSEVGEPKARPSTDSKKSSGDDDLTTKDILELLKDMDPIPIDMAVIAEEMRQFTVWDRINPNKMVSSADLASRYVQMLTKVKLAKFNRDQYDEAFEQLKGNGGLNELAVTSTGSFIASNGNGDFKEYSPDQINAGLHQQEGYTLMTNSNLLYERSTNPTVALRHELISVAQNGIGMEVITKQINEILQNLGTTKSQEEGFIQMGANGQVKSGLQFLQKAAKEIGDDSIASAMSVADYYQAGYLTEDQAQQAELALQYIYSALPTNAQALLQVKGGSPEGAVALIKSLVYSKTKSARQFKATPKKMSSTSGGSGGGSDSDKLKLSPVQMMQLGYTDHTEVTLQKGTAYAVKVNAQVLPLYNVNKESLGVTTLDQVATSTFSGALDLNNITMGGQLIDPHAAQNVQIDASNLYIMNLPIDRSSMDGTIKPDLAWLQKIEAIDKTIRDQNITDVAEINALYTEAGLPVLMDDNGQLNTRDYCKFGVLNGHALNSAFQKDVTLDNTIVEVEDEDQINNIMSILNKGRSEKDRIDFDSKSFWDSMFGTDHDTIYEGTIYIPVRTNPFTGMMGGGQYPTVEAAEEVEALVQQQQRTRGYVDPGLLTE